MLNMKYTLGGLYTTIILASVNGFRTTTSLTSFVVPSESAKDNQTAFCEDCSPKHSYNAQRTIDECDTCISHKGCKYCRKAFDCKCKDFCRRCKESHSCEHCHREHGCKCKKRELCEECLESNECSYCEERYDCECDSCSECHANHSCAYCKENYGCKCRVDQNKCKKCLEERVCDYCREKYACNCNEEPPRPPPVPQPTPSLLPVCTKCFEIRTNIKNTTWQRANDLCEKEGYKLASVRSPEEYNALDAAFRKKGEDMPSPGNVFWLAGLCYPHCGKLQKDGWYWTDTPYANELERVTVQSSWNTSEGNWDKRYPRRTDEVSALTVAQGLYKVWRWFDFNPDYLLECYVCERPCNPQCLGGPVELQPLTNIAKYKSMTTVTGG